MNQPFTVDFMIVGAQKCGTSTLFEILSTHPALIGSQLKEPHFFSKTADWRAHLEEYKGIFPEENDGLRFEASTTYTFFPHFNLRVWEDIYAFNPAMKIIYIVRDPVARIVSGYMHSFERGYTELPFDQAIIQKPGFINITRYATQTTPYIERFGRRNVHICFFEDLVRNPHGLMREVANFLGIDPGRFREIESTHANKSIGGNKQHVRFDEPTLPQRILRTLAPPIWRRVTDNSARSFKEKPSVSVIQRQMILHLLRTEIDELETLTGRDLSAWREIPARATTLR